MYEASQQASSVSGKRKKKASNLDVAQSPDTRGFNDMRKIKSRGRVQINAGPRQSNNMNNGASRWSGLDNNKMKDSIPGNRDLAKIAFSPDTMLTKNAKVGAQLAPLNHLKSP